MKAVSGTQSRGRWQGLALPCLSLESWAFSSAPSHRGLPPRKHGLTAPVPVPSGSEASLCSPCGIKTSKGRTWAGLDQSAWIMCGSGGRPWSPLVGRREVPKGSGWVDYACVQHLLCPTTLPCACIPWLRHHGLSWNQPRVPPGFSNDSLPVGVQVPFLHSRL